MSLAVICKGRRPVLQAVQPHGLFRDDSTRGSGKDERGQQIVGQLVAGRPREVLETDGKVSLKSNSLATVKMHFYVFAVTVERILPQRAVEMKERKRLDSVFL